MNDRCFSFRCEVSYSVMKTSHHPRLIDKEEKEEKDDSDDQQFPVHLVGSPDCFLDPTTFVGSRHLGMISIVPSR